MINVCFADSYPVICLGVESYFNNHPEINIIASINDFSLIRNTLKTKKVDILVIDLELMGLNSLYELKSIIKDFHRTKVIIFSNLPKNVYAPNAFKAGCFAYVHKSEKLNELRIIINKVNKGQIILDNNTKHNLNLIAKQNKHERLYRKLSNREIEVLYFLNDGKKNNEIAKILSLNEKTISTYKLRLLTKLNVTSLIDLVNKAKALEIV